MIYRKWWRLIEFIPDNQKIWRAVYKPDQLDKNTGKPKPAFFRDKRGLSCDIAIFSTPEISKRGHKNEPWPEGTGLIELTVSDVRAPAVSSNVTHKPLKATEQTRDNYAHCELTTYLDPIQAGHIVKNNMYKLVIKPDILNS